MLKPMLKSSSLQISFPRTLGEEVVVGVAESNGLGRLGVGVCAGVGVGEIEENMKKEEISRRDDGRELCPS
jgi:hypothetical protein